MSLVSTPFTVGKLVGTVYDFGLAGDVLPEHSHKEGQVHISIVTNGKFEAHGPLSDGGIWRIEMIPGKIYDWEADQLHEFVALENNSKMINLVK